MYIYISVKVERFTLTQIIFQVLILLDHYHFNNIAIETQLRRNTKLANSD